MTLTKKELAQNLSDQTELSLADAKKFVDLFFDTIKEQLNSGKTVKLSGLAHLILFKQKRELEEIQKQWKSSQFHQREKLNSLYLQKLKNLLTSLEI